MYYPVEIKKKEKKRYLEKPKKKKKNATMRLRKEMRPDCYVEV